jgi:hypothetical protein
MSSPGVQDASRLIAGIGGDTMNSPSPVSLWMNPSTLRPRDAEMPAQSNWLRRVKICRLVPPNLLVTDLAAASTAALIASCCIL